MTMQLESPMTFVRAMRGAPISILMAFIFSQKSMTNDELQRWTGYTDKGITKGVRLLIDLGWLSARSTCGPWCLAEGRQLPLMAVGEIESCQTSEKFRTRPLLSSSSIGNFPVSSYLEEEQEEAETSEKFRTPESPSFEENVSACKEMGIREPKASQIARLVHVTPQIIRAHVKQVKAEGLEIGTAIHRIHYNWEPSERYMEMEMGKPKEDLSHYFSDLIKNRIERQS